MHPQATKRIIVYKSLALVNLVDPINHINVFVKPRKKKSLLVQRHLPLFVTQAEQACHRETAFQTSECLSWKKEKKIKKKKKNEGLGCSLEPRMPAARLFPWMLCLKHGCFPACFVSERKDFKNAKDQQTPLPISRFSLQELRGPDWTLQVLKCRMATSVLPDPTVLGTSSKQPLAHCHMFLLKGISGI